LPHHHHPGDAVTIAYSATRTRRLPYLFELVPGVLLLLLIGFAGKLTEQSIAEYGKAHQLTLPNIEVRAVGEFHLRLDRLQHGRRARHLSRRGGHVRVLAEDRHRSPWRAITSWGM
jgi:hypothetical protein